MRGSKIISRMPWWFVLIIIAACFAYYLQTKIFMSGDVGYLVHETEQLVRGGKYGIDFLETNPPMILYFYWPIHFVTKIFSLDVATVARIYILLLAVASLSCSFILLDKIIKPQDYILKYILRVVLIGILFFLPAGELGQREHILLIMLLPYLFTAVLALENKSGSLNPAMVFLIGLFAGLAFSLKPYFVGTFILIELCFVLQKRSLWGWIRIESIVIVSVFVIYLFSILIFQPEYFKIIMPLVSKYYFIGSKDTWIVYLFNYHVFYCFMGVIAFFLFYKTDRYPTLSKVIFLALVGMIAAFTYPWASWFYHVIPAFSLTCLLLSNYLAQAVISLRDRLTLSPTEALLSAMTFVFFIIYNNNYNNIPNAYFGIIGAREYFSIILILPYLFSVLLIQQEQASDAKLSLLIAFFIGISAAFGIYLSPPFFILFVLLEMGLIFAQKKSQAALRVECITILIPLVCVSGWFLLFHASYAKYSISVIEYLAIFNTRQFFSYMFVNFVLICVGIVVLRICLFNKINKKKVNAEILLIILLLLVMLFAPSGIGAFSWPYFMMPMIGIICLMLAIYFINKKQNKLIQVQEIFILIAAAFFIFATPFYSTYFEMISQIGGKNASSMSELIKYINTLPRHYGIVSFSMRSSDSVSIVHNTHSDYGTRFPMMWWINGMLKLKFPQDNIVLADINITNKDNQFFIEKIAEDLDRDPPKLVIINKSMENDSIEKVRMPGFKGYINYFSQNEKFREAWKHYRYLKTIDVYIIYQRQ